MPFLGFGRSVASGPEAWLRQAPGPSQTGRSGRKSNGEHAPFDSAFSTWTVHCGKEKEN